MLFRSGYFEKNEFKNINNIKEIEEIILQYEGLAKLADTKVVEGGQNINRDDIPSDLKNIVTIQATNNVKRNILFNSGVFTIKEGLCAAARRGSGLGDISGERARQAIKAPARRK